MMKKRIISLLLAVMLLAGVMSVSAFAADGDVVIEPISWNDDGKYYAGDSFSVAVKIIPDGYAGVQIDVQTNDKVVFNGWTMETPIGYVEYEPGCDSLLWINGKEDDEGSIDVTDGLVNINNDAFEDGVFIDLEFDVVEDAAEGDVGEIEVTVKAASAEETWVVENATASTSVTISERPYTLGDVNGDGSITLRDVLRLKQYIADSTNTNNFVKEAADMNTDGSITLRDVLSLKQYIAKNS